jgi:hypothetical protein
VERWLRVMMNRRPMIPIERGRRAHSACRYVLDGAAA